MLTMQRITTLAALVALVIASPSRAQQTTTSGRPLSLEDALRIAETASEDVGIARAATDRAAGEQLRARSERFPQIFASLGYTRTLASQFEDIAENLPPRNPQALDPIDDNPGDPFPATCFNYLNPGGTTADRLTGLENAARCTSGGFDFSALPFGQRNNWTLGLDVKQTLFAGGRVNAQARMAGAGRRIAETSLASTRAQLVLNVIEAYYDAALADRLVSIAVSTLEQAETTLRHTQLARQVGNQPEFELLRATVSRDNQRPILIQRQSDRDIALMRLKQLLNLPLDEPLTLTTPLDDTTAAIPVRLTSGPPSLPDSVPPADRAPVRQATEAVEVSASALRIARSQRLPQVNVNMQYGRVAYPQTGLPVWSDFSTNWTVGVALQVPLFTGGRITGDVRVAQADLEEARYRLTQARELAQLDSYAAMARLEAAEASFAASAGTAQQAARAYQIAEIRYREGISTQVELSDSRILLEQASANRALAARDLAVARARVALLRDLPFGAIGTPSSGASAVPQQAQQQRPSAPQRPQQAAALTSGQTGAFVP
jgi:outer membrane protein TolC